MSQYSAVSISSLPQRLVEVETSLPWSQEWAEVDQRGDGWKPTPEGYFFHLAKAARDNGYVALIPITPGQKKCLIKGWNNFGTKPPSNDQMRAWVKANPQYGWGWCADASMVGFDIDVEDPAIVDRHIQWFAENVPGTPMLRYGRKPRVLVLYRSTDSSFGRNADPMIYHGAPDGKGQCVLFGTHPMTGRPYYWQNGSPALRPWSDLPTINGTQIRGYLAFLAEHYNGDPQAAHQHGRQEGRVRWAIGLAARNGVRIELPEDWVRAMPKVPRGCRHDFMVGAVSWCRAHNHSTETIIDLLFDPWMALFDRRDRRRPAREFESFLMGWAERKVEKGKALQGLNGKSGGLLL